jgi:protease-4
MNTTPPTPPVASAPSETPPQKPRIPKFLHFAKIAFTFFVAVPAFFFWVLVLVVVGGVALLFSGEEEAVAECSVARIPLYGVLVTTDMGLSSLLSGSYASADALARDIRRADEDPSIKAIVLDIDSPGGTPLAGDEVMQALAEAKKPTVAVVRDLGASAAYWAASGADALVASPASTVGSIGVTMSYTEEAGKNVQEGGRFVEIASGKFKEAGNPERELSKEEQAYFQKQVDDLFEYMLSRIAEQRTGVPKDTLRGLADGRVFLGTEAKNLGLVDIVGGFPEALTYIQDTLTSEGEDGEVVLCDTKTGFESWFE